MRSSRGHPLAKYSYYNNTVATWDETRIELAKDERDQKVVLTALLLAPGEERIVARRLHEVLNDARKRRPV